MPNNHPSKKQYGGVHAQQQKSIKSYFNVAPCSYTTSTGAKADPNNVYSPPPVPEGVASDLLNVGMRVRKSVFEGYKTNSHFSAITPQHNPSASMAQPVDPATSVPMLLTTNSRMRGLAPFCGLNKTGGLDVTPDEDDVPFFSSQASTITNSSIPEMRAGKRRYFEDDADEVEDANEDMSFAYVPGNRPIAVPSRSRLAIPLPPGDKVGNVITIATTAGSDSDFEDAGFLVEQSSDDADMDYDF